MGKSNLKYYKTVMVPCIVGVDEDGVVVEVENLERLVGKVHAGGMINMARIKDSKNYQDWLESSEGDLRAAGSNYGDGIYKHACLLSYQAIEKGLKAYLIYVQGHYPDTHDIKWLVKLCEKIDERFEYYRGVHKLYDGYYTQAKYPTNKELDINKERTLVMMQEAAKLCGFVEELIAEIRGEY